jgi:nucleotide-binding universal stress UspA family protein
VDLVVMATHGRGGIQRAWLGSVADQLVRTLEIPVLLVRGQPGPAPGEAGAGPILVPLDGSQLAEQVLGPAGALARLWGAELSLVQVVQPVTIVDDPALPLPTAYDEELTQEWRRQAQDYLDGLAGRLKEQGIRVTAQACIGWSPVQTLLDLARPERVRLVAVATHGRGGLQRLALGSVADKLVRAAEVPVLVHRPRAVGRKRTGASARAAR